MKFISKLFNIEVKETACQVQFPNYIRNRYVIRYAYFNDVKTIFLYPKEKVDSINLLATHINNIRKKEKSSVVVVLDRITAREREKYIRMKIPFIVKGKQCYLPFMGAVLTERCDSEIGLIHKLMPSAQVLLFFFIYNKGRDMYIQEAVKSLGFSPMTISRAVDELEYIGLIKSYKEGVQRIISTDLSAEKLFEKAKPYLKNPVKRLQYVYKEKLKDEFVLAGDSALSKITMINQPVLKCFATKDDSDLRQFKDELLFDKSKQVELQIWNYKPCIYEEMGIDPLSVATSYMDTYDERIEEAVGDMLNELWGRLNG